MGKRNVRQISVLVTVCLTAALLLAGCGAKSFTKQTDEVSALQQDGVDYRQAR